MGREIERKFLVQSDGWREHVTGSVPIVQGYLRSEDVAIRVRTRGDRAELTFKSREPGLARGEWEYEIPITEAMELIDRFCGDRVLRKTRHIITVGDHDWEIDEFEGRHAPLVIAEVELDEPNAAFARPAWLGREVTDDKSYYNEDLATS